MEFQLVFLSLTRTRTGSFANILLAVLHVCTVQTVTYTLTPLFVLAHASTSSRTSKGFAWANCLSMFVCWGLLAALMKGFAITAPPSAKSTPTPVQALSENPLSSLSLHLLILEVPSNPYSTILLIRRLPLAREWSEKYCTPRSSWLSTADLCKTQVWSWWCTDITGWLVECCLLWLLSAGTVRVRKAVDAGARSLYAREDAIVAMRWAYKWGSDCVNNKQSESWE